jgi:UDP-N-acetylmuramate: L-alanyl-gamma-D-glutamyl-meso-diaminopimelate ligase
MIHTQTPLHHIHFSGICGTAMGSLAVLLQQRGYQVTGSDQNVYPPMSDFLDRHNIPVQEGFAAENLSPNPDLIVIGNALSRGNPEVEETLAQRLPYISMAELLREFFIRGRTSLVVTGTHGKTTTTSLLAWTLTHAQRNPGFMIGGIAENLGTSCAEGDSEFFLTEGDEYDTAFFDKRSKFFHYQPDQLIINNLEFDHADIFASLEQIQQSFKWLLRLVPNNGIIVANGDEENLRPVLATAHSPVMTFGLSEQCDVQIQNIRVREHGTFFQVKGALFDEREWFVPLTGTHNVRNATAVLILAQHNAISFETIQEAFSQFVGIKRRQELRGNINNVRVYDDFAHHPTAVRETVSALRQKHPGHRLVAVFEPRSNTSVLNIHQPELTEAFVEADHVVLASPHRAAGIADDRRLNVQQVAATLRQQHHKDARAFASTDEILEHLTATACSGDIILIMSNGKFDNLHQRLLAALEVKDLG